jgi:NADPH-dependent 2,4-dienoyl-CoA reductase/sulfur reductase-like enzyme
VDRVAVVGASLAGLEAAKALRRHGFAGHLTIIGREFEPPYDRPPLSKELLAGTATIDDVRLDLGEAVDAQWRLGQTVTALDAGQRTLRVEGGPPEPYDGIVLATGASPVRPRWHDRDLAGVHVVRTLNDSLTLGAELRAGPGRVVVIGGGFIGTEVASTCRTLGLTVSLVEGLATPMQLALGAEVGTALGRRMCDHGVDVRTGTTVTALRGGDRVEEVVLADGTFLAADVVVVAVGVRPATEWLRGSGLTLDDGVVCDATGLAAPGIVAAGDVARWPLLRYGTVRRVEHWDNAIRQGRHAARRLLHGPVGYDPVPWFWSDQFGRKLQLIGVAAGYDELRIVAGSLTAEKFLGLYRRGGRLVAAVGLNSAKGIGTVRGLLERGAAWAEALSTMDNNAEGHPT